MTDIWKAFKAHPLGRKQEEMLAALQGYLRIPEVADGIAEQNFPDSARDSSPKNAFRHALGTGMLTQAMGGNQLSALGAKGLGYLWEGIGALDRLSIGSSGMPSLAPKHVQDTKHDLNANAIGAKLATQTTNQDELVAGLMELAKASRRQEPPGAFSATPGYLTHTVR